jgi:hypothetical protein
VYLNVDAMIDPSNNMMTSAVVLLMTRRRFVFPLKSDVNVPDAVGLSVSAGFAIRPPEDRKSVVRGALVPVVRVAEVLPGEREEPRRYDGRTIAGL